MIKLIRTNGRRRPVQVQPGQGYVTFIYTRYGSAPSPVTLEFSQVDRFEILKGRALYVVNVFDAQDTAIWRFETKNLATAKTFVNTLELLRRTGAPP